MKIKSILIIAAAVMMIVSCGGNRSRGAKVVGDDATRAEVIAVLDVDSLLAGAADLVDKQIKVEGICTHICQHGGRKIFLMGSNDSKIIRIESGDFGAFDQKCINSVVSVKGTLREERIDEAYLQRWEASVAAKTTEKHGDTEAGCSTEKKARGETGNTVAERITAFRAKIAARKASEGKEYLSFYYVIAQSYEVLE